jgi:hypothetical protein
MLGATQSALVAQLPTQAVAPHWYFPQLVAVAGLHVPAPSQVRDAVAVPPAQLAPAQVVPAA